MVDEAIVQNAADPHQIRAAKGKLKRADQERLEDMRYVLCDRKGRRCLLRYLAACGMFQSGYAKDDQGRGDALGMAFKAGAREIGLMIAGDIREAAPGMYDQMIEETRAAAEGPKKKTETEEEESEG